MRRLIVAILLLAVMIFGCFASYNRLDLLTQELAGHVLESDALLQTGDRAGADAILQETYHLWSDHRSMLGALVRHNELDDIENLFLRTMQAMDNHDNNEYFLQSRELYGMLLHIPEMELPSIENIF
ncbi:DUF4363 family protein [Intestinibacillus massiliensis]|uniref:DUF4363 family protein n=1 Tax=Intestinibacillus massiliensis TaxID=1871029 RepID=UPI000B34F32C|nr:DUF4363 family protein [Intestinibacillus massiliensis]MCB6364827.1 DUF4363 family protein [Intestinibacillus massiliensis]